MPSPRALLALVSCAALVAGSVAACSSQAVEPGDGDAGAGVFEPSAPGSPRPGDAGVDEEDARAPTPRPDAASETPCARERSFVTACKGELTCGAAGFDAWCAQRIATIDSPQRARAIVACVDDGACQKTPREACVYGHYAKETRSAAQEALLTAYCATCEPNDAAGCKTRTSTYDAAAGPGAVGDAFLAVWELADPLVDAIRTSCTGADAGAATPAACATAFSRCAGGLYVDALPNCP